MPAGNVVFAAHIAEVLERVSELREQLLSYSRHKQVHCICLVRCSNVRNTVFEWILLV